MHSINVIDILFRAGWHGGAVGCIVASQLQSHLILRSGTEFHVLPLSMWVFSSFLPIPNSGLTVLNCP